MNHPSHPSPQPPSPSAPSDPFDWLTLRSRVQTIPSRTQAPSGRIWELPFTVEHFEPFESHKDMLQIFPTEEQSIRAACEFALKNAPEHLNDFLTALKQVYSGWQTQTALDLLSGNPSHTPKYKQQDPVETSERAPRHVEVPDIPTSHWAYDRHFNPGNGINYHLTEEAWNRASHDEASSDVASILSYISRYNELAHAYQPSALRDAVFFGSFRAPYSTCMQICIMELKLPSHFLALVHYGLGFQFLSGNSLGYWGPKSAAGLTDPPERRLAEKTAFETSDRLFAEILRLYLKDFG